MSTANGHGLADPKRRGKPVSYANKGGVLFFLISFMKEKKRVEIDIRLTRIERESG